jgi:hypothetical protein
MQRFSAFLLILFCLAVTSAAPRPDELTQKSVGAWRLVSIEGNSPGRTNFYDRPTGLITYDPSGRRCVNIVLKADRKPLRPIQKDCSAPQPKKKPPLLIATWPISAPTPSMPRPALSPTPWKTISFPAAAAQTTSVGSSARATTAFTSPPSKTVKGVLARKDGTYKLLWEHIK